MSEEKNRLQDEPVSNEELTNEQPEAVEPADNNDNLSGEQQEPETDWKEKYEELNNSYLRLHAEFDNYRKRTLKEKADLLKTAGENIMISVLPVIDDFERALEHLSEADDLAALKEGVELIYNKFADFLHKNAVKKMDVAGKIFDVDKHEALTTIPAANDEQKDTIVDVIQSGYELGDKVIRYPKVIVAK